MMDFNKEALETVRNLTLQIMLISAGVFGIVGGFVSSSSKTFNGKGWMATALICFGLSTLIGYFLHGSMIWHLTGDRFDPYDPWIRIPGLIQILLFIGGGGFFVYFVWRNL